MTKEEVPIVIHYPPPYYYSYHSSYYQYYSTVYSIMIIGVMKTMMLTIIRVDPPLTWILSIFNIGIQGVHGYDI